METARPVLAIGIVFMASLLVPLRAHAACGDAAAVAGARAQVDADCDCASAANHGAYVRCALGIVRQRVGSQLLPPECKGAVRRCASASRCGKPGRVTCCRPAPGGATRCGIRTVAACNAQGGCAGSFPSCCDACGPGGCVSTSTSTTSTTSTTTSTVQNLCGDGMIEPGEQCDGEPYCSPGCGIPIYACCQLGPCAVEFFPVGQVCLAAGGTEIVGAHAVPTGGACPIPNLNIGLGSCAGADEPIAPTSFCCPLRTGGCFTSPASTVGDVVVAAWDCLFEGFPESAQLGTCGPGDVCIPAH